MNLEAITRAGQPEKNSPRQEQESMSVQARLRLSSHAEHVRINRHPLLEGLTRPDYPLANYHAVLIAYSHLYAAIERRIAEFLQNTPVPFDYSRRMKLNWLLQDRRALYERMHHRGALHVFPVEFPEITSIGQFIGVLYPIEGSTLGGQVISKHLHQHLGLFKGNGGTFFSGYGARTELLWNEFCAFADVIRDDPAQCRAAENATLLTFRKFEEVLDEYYRTLG